MMFIEEFTLCSVFSQFQKSTLNFINLLLNFEIKLSRMTRLHIRSESKGGLCLVLLQVSKCFVLVQIFWASPKIWLHLVPLQKLLCQHKKQFYWIQIIFCSGTKCLWLAQYVNIFLVWHKKIGPAQNILRPVKGQGSRL